MIIFGFIFKMNLGIDEINSTLSTNLQFFKFKILSESNLELLLDIIPTTSSFASFLANSKSLI